jgi:hypothetical protein
LKKAAFGRLFAFLAERSKPPARLARGIREGFPYRESPLESSDCHRYAVARRRRRAQRQQKFPQALFF